MENFQKCPYCGGRTEKRFQTWQIVIAVCFFPWGLLAFLSPKKNKCMVCGKYSEPNLTTQPVIDNVKINEQNEITAKTTETEKATPTSPSVDLKQNVTYSSKKKLSLLEQIKNMRKTNSADKKWLFVPVAIILYIILLAVFFAVQKSNYIKEEFAYAVQSQDSGDYRDALSHIENILDKDEDNEEAKAKQSELRGLIRENDFRFYMQEAKKHRDEGNYIEAYGAIDSALRLKPEHEEALQLKQALQPLYEEQKKQKEAEEAKKKAEKEAAQKAKQEAEAKAKSEDAQQAQQKTTSNVQTEQQALDAFKSYMKNEGFSDPYDKFLAEEKGDSFTIIAGHSYDDDWEQAGDYYIVYKNGGKVEFVGSVDSVLSEKSQSVSNSTAINGVTVYNLQPVVHSFSNSALEGLARNDTNRTITTYIYFAFYDSNGVQLGTDMDVITQLAPNGTAKVYVVLPYGTAKYDITDIEVYGSEY